MNQTIFENLPQKMNLISDLFSRVVFRDKEACQDLVKIILGEGYEVTGVTSQYGYYQSAISQCGTGYSSRDGGRGADSCRVSDLR